MRAYASSAVEYQTAWSRRILMSMLMVQEVDYNAASDVISCKVKVQDKSCACIATVSNLQTCITHFFIYVKAIRWCLPHELNMLVIAITGWQPIA